MAKRKSKKTNSRVKYQLPSGFWAQTGALFTIVLAIGLFVAWFGEGGPALVGLHKILVYLIGKGAFVLPCLMIYLAISVFRSKNNQLPLLSYISSVVLLIVVGGFFGISETKDNNIIGKQLNSIILQIVSEPIAIIFYILLIIIVSLFILRITPSVLIQSIKELIPTERKDQVDGLKVKQNSVAPSTDPEPSRSEFKLFKGVPTLSSSPTQKPTIINKKNEDTGSKDDKKDTQALVSVRDPNWKYPSINILSTKQAPADAGDVKQNAEIIRNTLHEFHIDVEMTGANIGPKVTQYTLTPPSGVKLTRIAALETNIALNLAAQSLRIEAPIPGKRAVGIEVPNLKAADVRLRGILESATWQNRSDKLTFAIGRDISGDEVMENLAEMPHLLIAGQTGSGKSVMINTFLVSLLYRNSPSDLKLILVDPKQVEMAPYENIPHLLTPIINDPTKTISALRWAVNEMERRYQLLASVKKRDIDSYNDFISSHNQTISIEDEFGNIQEHNDGAMPYIVIVIDEMADLMMAASKEVESRIVQLAQKARAVGIHLVLATQRPSVNVVTGLIKANVPARIAFTVASQVDSKTILDKAGAEKLLGKGDMLITTPKMNKPRRLQGAWVTDDEVMKITDFLRQQMPPQYNEEIISQEVNFKNGVMSGVGSADGHDEIFFQAAEVIITARRASVTFLQTRLQIGYARAAGIMDKLESAGVVGPPNGAKQRQVLMSSIDELKQN